MTQAVMKFLFLPGSHVKTKQNNLGFILFFGVCYVWVHVRACRGQELVYSVFLIVLQGDFETVLGSRG